MAQYLLSVHMIEGKTPPAEDEIQAIDAAVDEFNQKLKDTGAYVFAGGLHPADIATLVDATGSEVLITDGPFVEAKEQIGGFWVVEAPDLDAGLALAAKGSAACRSTVEVRPFRDEPEG